MTTRGSPLLAGVRASLAACALLCGCLDPAGPIALGGATTISSGRYLWVKLTLDDRQSAVIAGGGERDVSGVALTYTSTPAATKLGFTGASQTVAVSACSGALQVQSLDASGSPLAVAFNATVTLAGSNGVTFYSDAGCSTAITSLQLSSGSPASSSFYIKGPTTATVTLTATASGLAAASQTETVQPPLNGGAVKMAFGALQPTYNFGGTIDFTVTLQDQSGATATQSTVSVTVSLSQNPGGGALSGVTTKNAVNGVVSFSLGLTQAGSGYQLQAVANPALSNGTAFSSAFDLRAGQVAFSNPEVSGTVGACSGPLLVILRDVTLDDLDKDLKPAVADLFKPLVDRRKALDDRERTQEESARQKEAAREKALAAQAASEEARAGREREERRERERADQELKLAEAKARAGGGGFGGFGLLGGFARDPKVKALGEEVGLRLGLGGGFSLSGAAVVAPQIAARVTLDKGSFGAESFYLSFGLRGFFSPLAEGNVLGGGGGLKLSVPLLRHLTLYGWFAVEAYKTVSETVVAPLHVSGLELHL